MQPQMPETADRFDVIDLKSLQIFFGSLKGRNDAFAGTAGCCVKPSLFGIHGYKIEAVHHV
jgi:hypothetical protein